MPELNKPLFRKIKEHIRKQPKRLCMGWWIQVRGVHEPMVHDYSTWAFARLRRYNFPECETAACIGGWAVLLSGEYTPEQAREIEIGSTAKRLLGLSAQQERRLFSVTGWPNKFRTAYEKAKSHKAKGAAAIGRINYLLRYGK